MNLVSLLFSLVVVSVLWSLSYSSASTVTTTVDLPNIPLISVECMLPLDYNGTKFIAISQFQDSITGALSLFVYKSNFYDFSYTLLVNDSIGHYHVPAAVDIEYELLYLWNLDIHGFTSFNVNTGAIVKNYPGKEYVKVGAIVIHSALQFLIFADDWGKSTFIVDLSNNFWVNEPWLNSDYIQYPISALWLSPDSKSVFVGNFLQPATIYEFDLNLYLVKAVYHGGDDNTAILDLMWFTSTIYDRRGNLNFIQVYNNDGYVCGYNPQNNTVSVLRDSPIETPGPIIWDGIHNVIWLSFLNPDHSEEDQIQPFVQL